MPDLASIRKGWDEAARTDPMFHILSLPDMEGRWDSEEFFKTGRQEVNRAISYLNGLGLPRHRHSALDFGCGIGRLTQALSGYFDYVLGIDISVEMVRRAQKHCDFGNVRFRACTDLKGLQGDRDLIYPAITLQHMPPEYQRAYVQDFVGLLAPKGIALFQLPEGPTTGSDDFRSMWATPRDTVTEWVEHAGGKVVDVTEDAYSGGDWTDWRYAVTR